ncbi:A24 family peptidase [Pinisolibacter aquiterrae]|uniref:A24 family peptidase n=1 Tax=Pinisolibacter aquiterrae TaxID=2815579 RepID=UPI001C3D2A0F|nr:prepilin peptidase [Pinisolibacter aquiterrae]MBV5266824.1 prepilin peptidase [Pinisolibacter aquiterrae]MCC8234862.1 prepilin peptidase [Pinisolibacter aquiterrae]
MTQTLSMIVIALFPILTALGAATDFLTMTIPNRITLGLFAAGLAALALAAPGWEVVGWHLASAALIFVGGFALFALGWMGGGDVKFASAIALWLGWGHLLDFALGFSIYGGILTVVVLITDRALAPLPALRVGFLARFPEHRHVPYGIALTAAALHLFPSTAWFAVLMG